MWSGDTFLRSNNTLPQKRLRGGEVGGGEQEEKEVVANRKGEGGGVGAVVVRCSKLQKKGSEETDVNDLGSHSDVNVRASTVPIKDHPISCSELVKEGREKVVQIWVQLSEKSRATKEVLDEVLRTKRNDKALEMKEKALSDALREVAKERQVGKAVLEKCEPIAKRLCEEMEELVKDHAFWQDILDREVIREGNARVMMSIQPAISEKWFSNLHDPHCRKANHMKSYVQYLRYTMEIGRTMGSAD